MIRLALILALLPAAAHAMEFRKGQFVMVTHTYDADRNRFTAGAPDGEAEACFQVAWVRRSRIKLEHISGPFRPWWADETYAPGTYTDVWFSSDAYVKANPNADPLGELKGVFSEVAACP